MNALIYRGDRVAGWLSRHSVDILRVSLGLTFLGFGVLKFFPGVSQAEDKPAVQPDQSDVRAAGPSDSRQPAGI